MVEKRTGKGVEQLGWRSSTRTWEIYLIYPQHDLFLFVLDFPWSSRFDAHRYLTRTWVLIGWHRTRIPLRRILLVCNMDISCHGVVMSDMTQTDHVNHDADRQVEIWTSNVFVRLARTNVSTKNSARKRALCSTAGSAAMWSFVRANMSSHCVCVCVCLCSPREVHVAVVRIGIRVDAEHCQIDQE